MIAKHRGEIPVVILLIPFIAGITAGLYNPNASAVSLFTGVISLAVAFFVLNVVYRRFSVYKYRWLGSVIIYPAMFLAGWLLCVLRDERNNADHFSRNPAQYLSVQVNSEPTIKGDWTRFTAKVTAVIAGQNRTPVSGTLVVGIKDELARNLYYGEQLLIKANYTTVDPPFNPGEFNYKEYLARKNVYHQVYLFPGQYKITGDGYGSPVIAFALRTRQGLVKKFQRNMKDTTAIAVASTLILGYKADLSNDVVQAYSKTGTIHILSVSGGHVAIIYVLVAWALGFLNGNAKGRVLRVTVIITVIWLYALLTGFSPAVCRAALMISFVICGKAAGRYINALNLLACSALLLLLYEPFLIADVGFQLSYLAVAGLIVFEPVIRSLITIKNRVANYLWKLCSVSVAAQVITFPLSAYYFHQFPVYFLVSNLIIIVPIAMIMYTGLILLVLPQLPVISPFLGNFLEKTILLMNKGLAYIENAPYASGNKIWLTVSEQLLLYAIIIIAFYWLYNRRPVLLKLCLVLTLVVCTSFSIKRIRSMNTHTITFLNLRKHNGIVFKSGSEGVILTDLQDSDKAFRYSIQPCLDSNRILTYRIYALDKDIIAPFLVKRNYFVNFRDKQLILLNHNKYPLSISPMFNKACLFIGNNAEWTSRQLEEHFVIADGSNTNKALENIRSAAKKCVILKRNKSYIISSN